MSHPLRGTARAQVSARLLDLSRGGALMVLAPRLEVGQIYDFALEMEGETMWVQGEVRHCRPAEPEAGYRVGVQFVGIDPQDERKLQAYLDRSRGSSSTSS